MSAFDPKRTLEAVSVHTSERARLAAVFHSPVMCGNIGRQQRGQVRNGHFSTTASHAIRRR